MITFETAQLMRRQANGLIRDRMDTGWSYTLVSLLATFIREAEQRYLERDHSWTILGVEFGGDRPCVWYPYNSEFISIKLSLTAASSIDAAIWELAHETIHLLAPTGKPGSATNMEEGLATLFRTL